jgi:benzoyl-CoA reductase/2-hydroxyglutaryl-CoA dehydratase subunit BcrC/BadD/HgdB
LEKLGIPTFVLDMEYGTPFTGQIRTRLEAFLETLEGI